MLISHSHRFIFFHVAKTGGLSVRHALAPYAQEPDHFKINRPLREVDGKSNPLYAVWESLLLHATAADAQRQLPAAVFDGYFKFAFVRNPWEWQVSMYHFILREKGHPCYPVVASLGTFDAYLDWVIRTPRPFPKGAQKRQIDVLSDASGKLLVDRLGRYETLSDDFRAVSRTLGIEASLPHLNRSSHGDYRNFYTPITRDKLASYFSEDIHSFGYSFEAPSDQGG
ncbi:MAG: sulfotransferase family 2 domain-containing protein [Myxococcota bacterium]